MRKVKNIMTTAVIKVKPSTRVKDIAAALYENHLTGMPVVKDDKIVGIVTEADIADREANIHMPTYIQILDGIIYLNDPRRVKKELEKITGKCAKDIMTKNVVTINENADIHELATLILDKHVNPIPVEGDDGKLTGIVSRADLVKLVAEGD